MKWYSNLSKKVRTALLVGAWVLAVVVIVVVYLYIDVILIC